MDVLKLWGRHLEEGLLILTYSAMLAIASAQVFFRYVVNLSISWSQDLLTYLLIWSVFIGISLAVRKRRHLKVELALVLLNEKQQFYVNVLSNVLFMVFCAVFSCFSLMKVYSLIFINPQMSEATGLPMWLVQAAVPVGFLLTLYRLIQDTRLLFLERNGRAGTGEGC